MSIKGISFALVKTCSVLILLLGFIFFIYIVFYNYFGREYMDNIIKIIF